MAVLATTGPIGEGAALVIPPHLRVGLRSNRSMPVISGHEAKEHTFTSHKQRALDGGGWRWPVAGSGHARCAVRSRICVRVAIYHFSAKVISRSRGRSAVAAAAYRSASALLDDREGRTHASSQKGDLCTPKSCCPRVR